jgi:hypothetical protein
VFAVEEREKPNSRVFSKSPSNVDVQTLTEETVKLLRMNLDALYTTLGGQLLGAAPASKAAAIFSYLAAVRSASDAAALDGNLPTALSIQDLSRGLGSICENLMRDGTRYVAEAASELRESLNNEDLLRLSDDPSESHVQVIFMVVAAVLSLPRYLDRISVTVTAILLKQGLRNFCAKKN